MYVVPSVQRHLDELTFSGSAVNDLELQLGRERALYRQTLAECKAHLEETKRRLGASIPKSEPFIDVWRRARQVEQLFSSVLPLVLIYLFLCSGPGGL